MTDESPASVRKPGDGFGSAFGTFGELLQGVLPDDAGDFLVTFPVARWSHATFRFRSDAPLRVFPADRKRCLHLARMLLRAAGHEPTGELVLASELPVGKGMSSSSADLVATARAVGAGLGIDPTPTAIEDWLRRIEPTDGVMYPGAVVFDHRRVRLRASLGILPPLTVVAVDEGGQVDTVAFNRRSKPFDEPERREYGRLLERLSAAVRTGDVATVGEIANRSGELNQRLQRKHSLDQMREICRRVGGLGVVVAHSGTVLGVLLADSEPGHEDRVVRAFQQCTALAGTAFLVHSLRSDASFDSDASLGPDAAAVSSALQPADRHHAF